ncbi:Vps62-related protein [Chengkuizengella sp. SCS-71B]|uniref:Vps62-related protein n=1 Tax=Chengkuizengella sp. SCS-71B TaxID=3115290 RepID=UPI0032C217A6
MLLFILSGLLVLGFGLPNDVGAIEQSTKTFSVEEKLALITKYAPRIWFHNDEEFFPSSVEWSAQYMERYKPSGSNEYSLKTIEELNDAEDVLDFFSGNLDSARIYAGWREAGPNTIDIKYYIWYPYNRGKLPSNIDWLIGPLLPEYGHHVGDWEGMQIRLINGEPKQVQLNYHSSNKKYSWNDFKTVDDTHIVTYSAKGSHGTWKDPGTHVYHDLFIDELVDETSQGTAWDTWNAVEAYDFDLQEGLSNTSWPAWLSSDNTWTEPGKDPSDPLAGGVHLWGNLELDCNIFELCVLNSGPSGPNENSDWTNAFGEPATSLLNVAFLSAHGKYLVAENDGNDKVNANRGNVYLWEKFNIKVVDSPDGSSCILNGDIVNIETGAGYYLRATDNGDLDARASQPNSWEKFTLINHTNSTGCLVGGDQISLKSVHGKYVVGEDDGEAHANRSSLGSWEKFIVELH